MNRYRLQRYEDFTNWQNLRIFVKWPTDYFWIGKNYDLVVMPESTSRVNQYMLRYIYRFAQPTLRKMADVLNYKSNEDICVKVRQHNVMVIDDETIEGSTLNEILCVLRILNEDNEIVIFSLIGRKDLMADAG